MTWVCKVLFFKRFSVFCAKVSIPVRLQLEFFGMKVENVLRLWFRISCTARFPGLKLEAWDAV